MNEPSSYTDPAVRRAVRDAIAYNDDPAVTGLPVTGRGTPDVPFGLPQRDTTGVAVGFREGVAAERVRLATADARTCVAPGDQEHDHAMCQDVVEEESSALTWIGGPDRPEVVVTAGDPEDKHYPSGPKVSELAGRGPRTRNFGEHTIKLPSLDDAVVHVWGAFAGLAIELDGYGNIELVNPYNGSRITCPVPDQFWYYRSMAECYKLAIDLAQEAGWFDQAARQAR